MLFCKNNYFSTQSKYKMMYSNILHLFASFSFKTTGVTVDNYICYLKSLMTHSQINANEGFI